MAAYELWPSEGSLERRLTDLVRPPGSLGGGSFNVLLAQLLENFAVAISQNATVGKREMRQLVRLFRRIVRGMTLTIVCFHSLRNAKTRSWRVMFNIENYDFWGGKPTLRQCIHRL